MELLFEAGASVNARSDLGQTALILACKAKNIPATKLLLQKDVKLDAIDHQGWDAMCAAVSLMEGQSATEFGMLSVTLIELLAWHSANINGEDVLKAVVGTAQRRGRAGGGDRSYL